MGINIPESVRFIMNKLESNGYEAYIVGGCVRDSLLGITPKDYDVTTDALPEQIKACFPGLKTIDTGVKHGTVTVVYDNQQYEITTYRIDGQYINHRSPETVSFTKSLKYDLARRDFTINAMAYSDKTGLIDKFDGQKDLFNRKINCVSEPSVRFSEDALRILRALRFSSSLDFEIESITSLAIHEYCGLLECVSAERIQNELNLILCGNNPKKVLSQYSDVLIKFIPEIKPMIGFEQHSRYHLYDVWEHTVNAVASAENDLVIRLALLFHDIAKPQCFKLDEEGRGHFFRHEKSGAEIAEKVIKRLKYDNKTVENVCQLISYHYITPNDDLKVVKRLISKLGMEQFLRLIEVMKADNLAKQSFCTERLKILDSMKLKGYEIINRKDCLKLSDLKINGNDIALSGAKGPVIGAVLNDMLNEVVDGKLDNTREVLLANTERLINAHSNDSLNSKSY